MKHLVLAVLLASSTVAFAQQSTPPQNDNAKTPVVRKRQMNQRARIRQGVQSGELTKGEAANLRREQRSIQAEKKAAKSDGTVTPAERAQLRRDQNKASRDIYRKKHNNRTRAAQPQAAPPVAQ